MSLESFRSNFGIRAFGVAVCFLFGTRQMRYFCLVRSMHVISPEGSILAHASSRPGVEVLSHPARGVPREGRFVGGRRVTAGRR